MKQYSRTLTIAGSDSGGGAGIQADLKTFGALGCYGLSVITALTAQNTQSVAAIHPVPPAFIAQQIDAVMQDIGADAVKIGMLHSSAVIETVAERLAHYKAPNIVLDPVMVATSGDRLLQDEAIQALRSRLLPMSTVITPNLPEAAVLLDQPVQNREQMETACKALGELGPQAVLLKGGHLQDERSTDLLYINKTNGKGANELVTLDSPRVDTKNDHGTGCTLSSAMAAYLARGDSVTDAARQAKAYITAALQTGAAYQLGSGHGPVHHFHAFWE